MHLFMFQTKHARLQGKEIPLLGRKREKVRKMSLKKKRRPAQWLTSWKLRVVFLRQLPRETCGKRECVLLRIKCNRTPTQFERQRFFPQTNPNCGVIVILLKKTAVPATDSFHIATLEWDELFLLLQEPSLGVWLNTSHLELRTAPVGVQQIRNDRLEDHSSYS